MVPQALARVQNQVYALLSVHTLKKSSHLYEKVVSAQHVE